MKIATFVREILAPITATLSSEPVKRSVIIRSFDLMFLFIVGQLAYLHTLHLNVVDRTKPA